MNRLERRIDNRLGATLIMMVGVLVLIVGISAFMVDIGRMQLVRSQLQTAVDAGAIAGSLHLRNNPGDVEGAKVVAEQFVQQNRVGFMVTIPEEAISIETGAWDLDSNSFGSATPVNRNALRVLATQANEPYIFGGIFGNSTFAIPGQSVAVSGHVKLDIMMVLDLSGSMSDHGRIEALRAAAPIFLDVIEERAREDQIGVLCYGAVLGDYDPASEGHSGVVYTATPTSLYPASEDPDSAWVGVLESPLTEDFSSLRSGALSSSALLASKYSPWTPIGAALRDGAHCLDATARDDTAKFVVLMSDGKANRPNANAAQYALTMADYASGMNIRVHTISLGNSADEALMDAIANTAHGKHFIAHGTGAALIDSLTEAFRSVASEISKTTIVQ